MKRHYFEHDYSARNDQKVLRMRARHGWAGYGLYWAILESMAEDSTGHLDRGAIEGLSVGYGVPITDLSAFIKNCVEIGLFSETVDGVFFSRRMVDHKKNMSDFTEKGRIGAEKRWANRGAITGANAIRVKEIREDKSKDKDKGKEKSVPTAPTPRFVKPTIQEVMTYCDDRENKVDPQRFIDFYESKGWRVGNQGMKDWRAAVRTWEKRDQTQAGPAVKPQLGMFPED